MRIAKGNNRNGRTGLAIRAVRPPFRVDKEGIIRVGKSDITLDVLLQEHENGKSPEDIVLRHEALDLADVYATVAYYLRHRGEMRAYLQRQRKQKVLSNNKLRAFAKNHKPPSSWFNENTDGLY